MNNSKHVVLFPYLEGLTAVVSPTDRISSGKNRSTGIQRCLDPCLSDGYGLLFHCLVNSYLVSLVHLVKLIYTADSLIERRRVYTVRLRGKKYKHNTKIKY